MGQTLLVVEVVVEVVVIVEVVMLEIKLVALVMVTAADNSLPLLFIIR